MLPSNLEKYFWEVNPSTLDATRHAAYIIERLLEYGDLEAAKWMLAQYPKETIIQTLKTSRQLSKKTAHFWASYFEVAHDEILCLQEQFQKTSRAIWKN